MGVRVSVGRGVHWEWSVTNQLKNFVPDEDLQPSFWKVPGVGSPASELKWSLWGRQRAKAGH